MSENINEVIKNSFKDDYEDDINKINHDLENKISKIINDKIYKDIKEASQKFFDPYYDDKKDLEIANKYKDLFKIITVNKPMNYVIFTFIEKLIKQIIKAGYLTHKYKDFEGKEHVDHIALDKLENISFIYDQFKDNEIIMMHKYKTNNKEKSEPIFMPYITKDLLEVKSNFKLNEIKSKYYINPEIV